MKSVPLAGEFPFCASDRRTAASMIFLLVVAAAIFFNFSVSRGLTIPGGDSVYYLGGARSMLDHKGFVFSVPPTEPIALTHFQPLYSLTIAAAGSMLPDLYAAARLVNVFCFAATVVFSAL